MTKRSIVRDRAFTRYIFVTPDRTDHILNILQNLPYRCDPKISLWAGQRLIFNRDYNLITAKIKDPEKSVLKLAGAEIRKKPEWKDSQ